MIEAYSPVGKDMTRLESGPEDHSEESESQDHRSLTRRHSLALGLVAALILVDQLLVQPPLWKLATDAPVINLAGRQRVLSQKLAKTALELDLAGRSPGRDPAELVAELRAVSDLWSTTHEALRRGDSKLSIAKPESPILRAAWAEIDPIFDRIYQASRRLMDRGELSPHLELTPDADLGQVLALESGYLDRMDRIVGLLEAEARGRVAALRQFGWFLAGFAWVALLGIGWLVLRPSARMINHQFGLVRNAQRDAEAEVERRTQALEQANAKLLEEAEHRMEAQAKHRALVEQFSHVSRTNTVGEMATGLAHEINQPLGAVANYLEGCLIALDDPNPPLGNVREALSKALAATHRAGQILHRIRHFVRRHPVLIEQFDANRIVIEVAAMLRDEVRRHGIRLDQDLAPGLPKPSGDPVQVQQVLVNLVRNAIDALRAAKPHDPTLTLATERGGPRTVRFNVTDNGEGIPPEKLPHVFDPFFSTRADGMGMGLAISRTIVEAHQGRLSVESTPGLLTTFQFTLPAAGEPDDDPSHGIRRG